MLLLESASDLEDACSSGTVPAGRVPAVSSPCALHVWYCCALPRWALAAWAALWHLHQLGLEAVVQLERSHPSMHPTPC